MSDVKIKLDLSRFRRNIKNAQEKLANQVLADCKPIMPSPESGSLSLRSYVTKDNKQVIFPGPYAKYLYYGNKMYDPKMGGPFMVYQRDEATGEYIKDEKGQKVAEGFRYRKGAKPVVKKPIEKLKFTRPEAQEKWFEVAKTNHLKEWQQLVNDEIKKR